MKPSAEVLPTGGTGRSSPGGMPIALAAVLAIAGLALVVGWLLIRGGPRQPQAPVLTPEARAYIRSGSLKLSGVGMSAKENFARQTLVEITGKITNAGERPVKLVEVTCIFYDPFGRVVLRERVAIVSARMAGLMPGETKEFRLPFDTLPESWNQALPDLVIAQIVFG
jgi:hypothetical protein